MEEVVLKLNNFEGPFDLLLNLIEKNKNENLIGFKISLRQYLQ